MTISIFKPFFSRLAHVLGVRAPDKTPISRDMLPIDLAAVRVPIQ